MREVPPSESGPQNNKMQRTSRGSNGGSPLIWVFCGLLEGSDD